MMTLVCFRKMLSSSTSPSINNSESKMPSKWLLVVHNSLTCQLHQLKYPSLKFYWGNCLRKKGGHSPKKISKDSSKNVCFWLTLDSMKNKCPKSLRRTISLSWRIPQPLSKAVFILPASGHLKWSKDSRILLESYVSSAWFFSSSILFKVEAIKWLNPSLS